MASIRFSPGLIVTVLPRDHPRYRYGRARLVRIIDAETVVVRFVMGQKRDVSVPRSCLSFPTGPTGHLQGAAVAQTTRAAALDEPPKPETAAPEPEPETAAPVPEPEPEPEPAAPAAAPAAPFVWQPVQPNTPTWRRLLIYGDCSSKGLAFSDVGMRCLWSLFLDKRSNVWLNGNNAHLPDLSECMNAFYELWWEYCVSCAHATPSLLTHRHSILVLELICGSMAKANSKHTRVFAALLMQTVVVYCNDQSLCSIVADSDDVGYAHRVDKAKIGVVMKAKSLLRHEGGHPELRNAMDALRDPKRVAVWLLKNASGKFKRLGKKKLHEFPLPGGGAQKSRVDPVTGNIKFWSEELDVWVDTNDYYTTLDGVRFKRCGDQLRAGDTVLLSEEFTVLRVESAELDTKGKKNVVLLSQGGREETLSCPYKKVFPVGTRAGSDSVLTALKKCPDVMDTMCLSVGHPTGFMRKRRRTKVNEMQCGVAPLKCPWKHYVLWRCAVAAAGASLGLPELRVAQPYLRQARFSWLSLQQTQAALGV